MKYIIGFAVLVSVVLLAFIIFYSRPVIDQNLVQPSNPTVTIPAEQPSTSAGQSQSVQDLPTMTPHPPGSPIPEVNPRRSPKNGSNDQSQNSPLESPDER